MGFDFSKELLLDRSFPSSLPVLRGSFLLILCYIIVSIIITITNYFVN